MKPLLIRPAALVCHQFPIGLAVDPSALPPPHAVSVRRPDGWGGSFEPGSPADVPPRPGEVVCTCGGPDGCTVEIGWGKHHEVGAVRATFFQAPRLA
jgi:hypothetical protein